MFGRIMRVGFLFNHYAVHQLPHAAPYAFELSRMHPEFEVVIACGSRAEMRLAKRIGALYPGHRCTFRRLRQPIRRRLQDPFISGQKFARKKRVLAHNLEFFRGLDALVAPEKHCLRLKSKYGLDSLKLIHTRHGAGDREGGFDDRSGHFDFTILPGQKYVDRLTELGFLSAGRYAVAGWPKFEAVTGLQPEPRRLFDNENPVVIYNPHFDQDVSSWHAMGNQVLELFAERRDLNLIFAPHVVLFRRHKRHEAILESRFRRIPNILVDKGSLASSDMTYIRAADIYLGDVSSQVYEFLLEPRPCIFLNAHGVDWEDDPNYFQWTLGQVVDDVEKQLAPALERAQSTHAQYRSKQEAAFDYTFHTAPDSTAAQRGALEIAAFL
ncbi:MAG: hypothetical protein GY944_20705, partial [bacterium]|nr:hypothetical protein [bacterium]